MKNTLCKLSLAALCAMGLGTAHALVVTNETNATALANAIAGSGVIISNATLTTDTTSPSATFTGGAASVGFETGIVLTTGTTDCVVGPNTVGGCSGAGTTTSLRFDFTSTTGQIFFNYVFGSEEYTQYVNSSFNDEFQLLLNGVNIAVLPGGAGVVSINNVNCTANSSFYRNNRDGEANQTAGCVNQNLDVQYDGLTTVLTASALLNAGVNTFEFLIFDRGDSQLDSGVFIQAGSFSGVNETPEPASLALMGLGLAAAAAVRRRKSA
ncbi:MAG: PEP-CTERM sorting domain-containing protein [Rhizobacter sp.]